MRPPRSGVPYSVALLALVFLSVLPNPIQGQTPPEIESAQRLQADGQYAAAAESLRPYVRAFPNDLGTRWLFGRLLYWAGEFDEARVNYEAVAAEMPDDPWLKLEYAELLLGMGRWGEARTLFQDVAAGGPPDAALQAKEGLADIRLLTRPWVRIAGSLLDDNQPYRRYEGMVEGGGYLHPLWSLSAGGTPRLLDAGPDPSQSRKGADGWAQLRGHIPQAGLHLSARGGGTVQGDHRSWIGGAELGVDLPGELRLVASANRTRYLWTLASADSLVMVNAAEVRLDRADAPGWAGEAVFRRDAYADDNRITTAYAWILAPLLGEAFRVGYAFAWSDAEESRWTTPLPGRYAPYHTPNDETVHSALANVKGNAGSLALHINGSVGVHALEQAPVLIATEPDATTLYFYERSFTPWRVTLGASVPLSAGLTFDALAEAWETAYYELKQLAVGMTYTFGSGGP